MCQKFEIAIFASGISTSMIKYPFSKIEACIWSPDFRKIGEIACQKHLKLAFLIRFKNGLCHLDPIFMPFSKWGITFLYLKNWRSY